MPNFKCVLEYDGTMFDGWSKQPGQRTVQGETEKALCGIFKTEIPVVCAGRTDKGVHAYGQTINFKTVSGISAQKLLMRLNSLLPHDAAVKSVKEVSDDFDARKSAESKTYIYRVYTSPVRSPLFHNRAWHISKPINLDKMKKSAEFLKGKKDFSVFDSYNSVFDYKIADLKEIKVAKKEKFIDIYVTGDRFLYKMIRKIAGELVRIGKDEQTLEKFKDAVLKNDKTGIGKPAPACGLYLAKVRY